MHQAPASPAPSSPTTPTLAQSLRHLAGDIKLAHSIFALPFAILASVLAGPFPGSDAASLRRFAGQLGLVVVCMVLARTWAMLINRLADKDFDKLNQRTARRALASGKVGAARGWMVALACALGFLVATAGFWFFFENRWPVLLSVPTLALLAFYSYTKRFTALCHVVLGACLAFSPIAAAIAIRPEALTQTPVFWWLAGFVAAWVAGFDVVYALQDIRFDRERGLSSIPAPPRPARCRLGQPRAHAVALACLVMVWRTQPGFGLVMGLAVLIVAAVLVWEHALVAAWLKKPEVDRASRSRSDDPPPALQMAFFTLNGVVSCVVGLLGVLDWVFVHNF